MRQRFETRIDHSVAIEPLIIRRKALRFSALRVLHPPSDIAQKVAKQQQAAAAAAGPVRVQPENLLRNHPFLMISALILLAVALRFAWDTYALQKDLKDAAARATVPAKPQP